METEGEEEGETAAEAETDGGPQGRTTGAAPRGGAGARGPESQAGHRGLRGGLPGARPVPPKAGACEMAAVAKATRSRRPMRQTGRLAARDRRTRAQAAMKGHPRERAAYRPYDQM